MAATGVDVDLSSSRLEGSEDPGQRAGNPGNGNETVFREFVERYQVRIYRVALAILGTPEHADEMARKAFAEAHRAFCSISSENALFIRTHRITVDECYRFLGGRRLLLFRPRGPAEGKDQLNKLLVRIPPQDRHVLLLRETEGYSTATISQLTGLTDGSICDALFRTRHRLAGELYRESTKRTGLLRLTGLLALLAASTATGRTVDFRPSRRNLQCEVTRQEPCPGFDLRFHDDFRAAIPTEIFGHTEGTLQTLVRVKPGASGAGAVTFSRALAIPEFSVPRETDWVDRRHKLNHDEPV